MNAAERRTAISEEIAECQRQQQQYLQEIQATLYNATQVLGTAAEVARPARSSCNCCLTMRMDLQGGQQAVQNGVYTRSVEEQIGTLTLLSKTRDYGTLLAVCLAAQQAALTCTSTNSALRGAFSLQWSASRQQQRLLSSWKDRFTLPATCKTR